jgi:hypothetical protein
VCSWGVGGGVDVEAEVEAEEVAGGLKGRSARNV